MIKSSKKHEEKITVQQEAELMAFLIAHFPKKSRDNIKSLLRNKLVQVNGATQTHVKFPLQKGDYLAIGTREEKLPSIPGLKIKFEDEHLIVVEKPAGLLTIATEKERTRTLYNFLSKHVKKSDPNAKIFVVHRLDRETSGLLVFAKSEEVKFSLQKNWSEKERTYIALVEKRVAKEHEIIRSFMKESKALKVHSSKNETYGDEAITEYKIIERRPNATLLDITLHTGRKNQIRVHMQEIGHPIIGDKKYGAKTSMVGRIALHAKTLSFVHPKTKEKVSFQSKMKF